jgi:hypothetical protein
LHQAPPGVAGEIGPQAHAIAFPPVTQSAVHFFPHHYQPHDLLSDGMDAHRRIFATGWRLSIADFPGSIEIPTVDTTGRIRSSPDLIAEVFA